MANIFVSYSRENKDITRALVEDIKALGHTVWLDQELSGGQAWWDQILEIIRSSDVFVFVLNPDSLNSSACSLEYNYAADLGKTILPVLMSGGISTNLLPPALSKIQFVDYQKMDRDAVLRLAKALTNTPPPQPLPKPLPVPPEAPISYLGSFSALIDSKSNLSYEEQSTLLVDLKKSLHAPETVEDTRTLLERLRHRRDLFATIAEEIDELLRNPIKKITSPHTAEIQYTFAKTEKESKNGLPLLLWFALVAYIGFTVLLLLGSSRNQLHGLMFMSNSVIVILGSVASYFSKINISKICGIGGFGQIGILIIYLVSNTYPEASWVFTHMGITGAFFGMMVFYAFKERKQPQAN